MEVLERLGECKGLTIPTINSSHYLWPPNLWQKAYQSSKVDRRGQGIGERKRWWTLFGQQMDPPWIQPKWLCDISKQIITQRTVINRKCFSLPLFRNIVVWIGINSQHKEGQQYRTRKANENSIISHTNSFQQIIKNPNIQQFIFITLMLTLQTESYIKTNTISAILQPKRKIKL